MRYLLRRMIHAVFLLFGVSVLTFLFSALTPGTYFDEMRLNPQISPETLTALRAQYQLDRPLPVRYIHWLNSVAHGNLGFSFAYNSPVAPILIVRARNTLLLTLTATILAWLVGLAIGIWSAYRLNRATDRLFSSATAALLAIPELVLALGLLILAVRTGWFPTGGLTSADFESLSSLQKIRDLAFHLTAPVLALTLAALPTIVRHVRAAIADELQSPFLRAAQAHGISTGTLLFNYAPRAAAAPLISLFGLSIATLLSGSLVVEIVMSWPGLGPLLLEATLARDFYVVIAGVLLSVLFLVAGNLLADLLLYFADPRIRANEAPNP
jgi:peptide/nickel transport system permease protein